MTDNQNPPNYFAYDDSHIAHLTEHCPKLGEAIAHIGKIERKVNADLFSELMRTIIGQQISAKAIATIWGRMQTLLGEVTPETVANIAPDSLQTIGVSHRKVDYIVN